MSERTTGEHADRALDVQRTLSALIKQQFRRSVLLVAISVLLAFTSLAVLYALTRTPANGAIISQLEASNARLEKITLVLASDSSIRTPELLAAVAGQASAHQEAIGELRKQSEQLPPSGFAFLQLLGGSAVLALLGYLGLQRLQNIDTEIQGLREFMFSQIRERVGEGREILGATVRDEVARRLLDEQQVMQEIKGEIGKLSVASRNELERLSTEGEARIAAVEDRVRQLLERYQWLEATDVRQSADAVASLVSAEQAHTAAQRFRFAGDAGSARLALRAVVEKHLLGTEATYHNLLTEAMHLDDPVLGLQLVDEGLAHFPDNFDLLADKAQCFLSTGKPRDAIEFLEAWRQRAPSEFARGWRPAVFYANAVQATELTEGAVARLEAALSDVCERSPYEIKPWSSYARFMEAIGRIADAERVCRDGLRRNPYSQELHFVLGNLLLRTGRASEAVEAFRSALAADFVPSYQHHVAQVSLRVDLAQAYEAKGDVAQAEQIYRLLLDDDSEFGYHIRAYSRNRLIALAALRGESPVLPERPEASSMVKLERLKELMDALHASTTSPSP
jgi:tetratricopeptide (TPR) repeat protein